MANGSSELYSAQYSLVSATLRMAGSDCACAPAQRRKGGGAKQCEAFLDMALFLLCDLECPYHLLGWKRNRWRRYLCSTCKLTSNVGGVRTFPALQKEIQRRTPLSVLDVYMDSLGEMVYGIRRNFLALVSVWKCLCQKHKNNTVVRIYGHSRRLAMGLGCQSLAFRPYGKHTRGRLVPLEQICKMEFCHRHCYSVGISLCGIGTSVASFRRGI
jgi:hypothetical protein